MINIQLRSENGNITSFNTVENEKRKRKTLNGAFLVVPGTALKNLEWYIYTRMDMLVLLCFQGSSITKMQRFRKCRINNQSLKIFPKDKRQTYLFEAAP